jgi:hypothetical protein
VDTVTAEVDTVTAEKEVKAAAKKRAMVAVSMWRMRRMNRELAWLTHRRHMYKFRKVVSELASTAQILESTFSTLREHK